MSKPDDSVDYERGARYVTTAGAARMLGISPEYVRKLANAERIPCERTAGGQRLFEIARIRDLMRAGRSAFRKASDPRGRLSS